MLEVVERRAGEAYIDSIDIETAWMQEVAERHRRVRALEFRILKTRGLQEIAGRPRGCHIWNHMNAGSCWGALGGSLDIETRWMQEVVKRLGGKDRYWNPMNAGNVGSLMRGTRGGSLDIETRWMSPSEALSPRLKPSLSPCVTETGRKRSWKVGVEKRAEMEGSTEPHDVLDCFLPCCMVAQL